MPNCSQLPVWISISQALTVPVIAAVIAAFGAWIAARQMVIADEKLKLDAFDRQYARRITVYEATRKFLADVYGKNISDENIRIYRLCVLDAKFLFDDDLYKYLSEICRRVTAWNSARSHSSFGDFGKDNRSDDLKKVESENLNWINQQGDEQTGFDVRFRPFLMHKQVKRSWWLRWP